MSFQHKSFWMLRDGGCQTDGEMGYNNSSRIQPKRNHQWFMDSTGPELFNNKRQAIEAVGSRPVSGISDMTFSSWPNASSFQSVSGQFPDRPFRSEPLQTFNLGDGNTPIDSGNMNVVRKDFEHQYDGGSSVSLSMSHTTEDASPPCLSFGVRKVKVNQVRDSNSAMAASMGTAYNRSDNTISLGPTYGNVDENTISTGPAFSKVDGNFISMGHTFNKGDGSFISIGHNYNKGNENILSMGQSFDKGDGSFISIGQSYEKGDSNLISLSSSYGNENDNFISMAPSYNKHESVVSMAPSSEKGVGNLISIGQSYDKSDFNVTAIGPAQDKGDSSILSMGQNYNKDECHAISFGSFHDEPEANCPGSIISSYDLLMNNHSPVQVPDVAGQKELVEATPGSNVNGAPKSNSKTDTKAKTKEPKTAKKVPPNNFPSNVKSLLSTGILDGVHVKYVSWSREKSLKGYIKGTGYSCGCTECKFEKALNAYEFERHANCKTKHPNNHIYFENGKTIYAVVQELKNTPQEMLFDAIQNVTGSRINEKNFRVWKASYQAATRELQRIYGKDEVPLPS